MDANNTWAITGNNAGNINNDDNFSGFGNLTGGSNNDTFIFSNGTRITGLINGTNLASLNTLNYLLYATPVTVTYTDPFTGNTQNNSGEFITHFTNINNILQASNPSPPPSPIPDESLIARILSPYETNFGIRGDLLFYENIDNLITIENDANNQAICFRMGTDNEILITNKFCCKNAITC